jgi:CHASE3 domain sensor protein/two-component sensor histidine kinase
MTITGKIDIAFFALVGIIAAGFYYTFKSNERLRAIYEFTDEAQEINAQLNETLIGILDIESGQRGFVLTGRRVFLLSYEEGKLLLPLNLDTLDRLITNEAFYIDPYNEFKRFISLKIALNDSAVHLKATGRDAEASEIISGGRGKILMDSIKFFHHKIENSVIGLLNREGNEKVQSEYYSSINFITLSIIILASLIIGYSILRRNARQLLEYQEKQKALINELTARNSQLDDFAHIVSHNLRSSSSNISGLVEMVNEDHAGDENKEIFVMLKKASVNLTDTLNDILETLVIKGGPGVPREHLLFSDVAARVIDSMSADIINSKAEIVTDFESVSEIIYPKVYLESILSNLVSNAIKYSYPGRNPVITLSTYRNDGRIVLQVSDNGIGINLSKHGEKIFRYKQTFHDHPQAKGVGLFLIKNQIELMGGSIRVLSEPEKGTTFQVVF